MKKSNNEENQKLGIFQRVKKKLNILLQSVEKKETGKANSFEEKNRNLQVNEDENQFSDGDPSFDLSSFSANIFKLLAAELIYFIDKFTFLKQIEQWIIRKKLTSFFWKWIKKLIYGVRVTIVILKFALIELIIKNIFGLGNKLAQRSFLFDKIIRIIGTIVVCITCFMFFKKILILLIVLLIFGNDQHFLEQED